MCFCHLSETQPCKLLLRKECPRKINQEIGGKQWSSSYGELCSGLNMSCPVCCWQFPERLAQLEYTSYMDFIKKRLLHQNLEKKLSVIGFSLYLFHRSRRRLLYQFQQWRCFLTQLFLGMELLFYFLLQNCGVRFLCEAEQMLCSILNIPYVAKQGMFILKCVICRAILKPLGTNDSALQCS